MGDIPTFELSNGLRIPAIGFGIGSAWRIKKTNNNDKSISAEEKLKLNPVVIQSIKDAISAGFKLIDGAEAYFTRKELAIAKAELQIPRDRLFLTDKYSNSNFEKPKYTPVNTELETALSQVDTDYLDLFMLHSLREPVGSTRIEDRWAILEMAYESGKIRALGASNCNKEQVERILKVAKIKPHVLQLYYHPLCQHYYDDLLELAKQHGIVIEAYSPLAPLTKSPIDGNSIPAQEELKKFLATLASKYEKTDAQILLRWTYQKGFLPVTTTSKPQRLKEALAIFDFKLAPEDEQGITDIGKNSQEIFGNISVTGKR